MPRIASLNGNSPPSPFNNVNALVQSDPLLRRSLPKLRQMLHPRTYREMMQKFSQFIRRGVTSRQNKLLRALLSAILCFLFLSGFEHFYDKKDNLSEYIAKENLVWAVQWMNRLQKSTFGRVLETHLFIAFVSTVARYAPSVAAARYIPNSVVRRTWARSLMTGVAMREATARAFPEADMVHSGLEKVGVGLIKVTKEVFTTASDRISAPDLQRRAMKAFKTAEILTGKNPSAELYAITHSWYQALYVFCFWLAFEYGTRSTAYSLQWVVHSLFDRVVYVQRLPGGPTITRALRSGTDRLVELIGDDTATTLLLGPAETTRRTPTSSPRTSPRSKTRGSGSRRSPAMSNAEATQIIRSSGGRITFTRGPRKGQPKNSAALRRNASRISRSSRTS